MNDKERIMQEEKEANQFAYELLMPSHMVKRDIAQMPIVDIQDDSFIRKMAKRYGVSLMAMSTRINQLYKKQIPTAF